MIKKSFNILILFIICFYSISNSKVYCAYKTNSQKQHEAVIKALDEYLSPYMDETCDRYERVLSYQDCGEYSRGGPWGVNEPITSFAVKYSVEVPDKNNTKWLPYVNVVYMDFDIIDGEYVIKRIFDKPDNLEKFEKAFEEYKELHNDIVQEEIVAVQAETNKKNSKEIVKIKNSIYIISIFLIILSLLSFVIRKHINNIKKE